MTGKSLDDESEWGWKLGIGSAKRWAAKKGKKNKDKGEVSRRRLAVLERGKENKLTKEIVGVGALFFFGNSLLRNL